MPQSGRLLLGVIVGPRGIRGEVKVKTFTEHPEDIVAYGPLEDATGKTCFNLELVGFAKSTPVVRIKGVADRNKAEALKGTELYVSRDVLPETEDADEFYHADLIGLDAVFEDGTRYGKILRVCDFGAGDMLEIVPEGQRSKAGVFIPFTREMVPVIDLEAGRVVLDLPEDFFAEPEKVSGAAGEMGEK
ncbi:ribosome maturation factor RimM [Sneathiella chinensis]|uniref:Ribosome maturation factor RimM n=1 Tax=Sneathiella chinensis TaxID=349750 RepID=A0ABQ5U9I0_9PROT|nr:ribosome maturation factor RimM [Sneathiella chinensis]GLQ07833.1 ribosome maturation factor RimM [Sneathiella chinensis]